MKLIDSKEIIRYAENKLCFSSVGILKPSLLGREAKHLEAWLKNNFHGEMAYMEKHFDKRINPKKIMPEVKTIIVVTSSYSPKLASQSLGIARYAQGKDYHLVLKEKLKLLFDFIVAKVGSVNGKAFVDSAPLMEKALAKRAGLGWIGKNGNLISRKNGSYFFIASLLLDVELEAYQKTYPNYCGSCTACLDNCPTGAIVKDGIVDSRKCISYLTIELKRDFTETEKKYLKDEWIFGCDICQEVCPWNRFAQLPTFEEFQPRFQFLTKDEILSMTKSSFKNIFHNTALFRTGLRRLKRNIKASKKQ